MKKAVLIPLESLPVLLAHNRSCGIVCAYCRFTIGKVELPDLLKSHEQLPVLFFSAPLDVGSCFLLGIEFSLKKKKSRLEKEQGC